MPLSEHEQRMLEEIENALYAEDPAFASTVRRTSIGRRRPSVGVVGLVVTGLVLLVGGFFVPVKPGGFPVLSFLGFLLVFAAGVLALRSSSPVKGRAGGAGTARGSASGTAGGRRGRGGSSASRPGKARGGARGGASGSYTERMEDRFRRRFEG